MVAVVSDPVGDQFWDVVDESIGSHPGQLSEFADAMAPYLFGLSGVELAVAALSTFVEQLSTSSKEQEVLVIAAEAMARALPEAYLVSRSLTSGRVARSVGQHLPDAPGPLVATWVERLSGSMSDSERMKRVSQVALTILDDLFVTVVNDVQRLENEVAAVVRKLASCP